MNISLDYDDTFTADPALWTKFIEMAQAAGHTVYCVTQRDDTFHNQSELKETFDRCKLDIEAFFTSCEPKDLYMGRRGITIDVWIDDNPFRLVNGC